MNNYFWKSIFVATLIVMAIGSKCSFDGKPKELLCGSTPKCKEL